MRLCPAVVRVEVEEARLGDLPGELGQDLAAAPQDHRSFWDASSRHVGKLGIELDPDHSLESRCGEGELVTLIGPGLDVDVGLDRRSSEDSVEHARVEMHEIQCKLFDAWHQWFWELWQRGDGFWIGGCSIERHVLFGDYDGFGGEW